MHASVQRLAIMQWWMLRSDDKQVRSRQHGRRLWHERDDVRQLQHGKFGLRVHVEGVVWLQLLW
jgi:hypothetical protein